MQVGGRFDFSITIYFLSDDKLGSFRDQAG
jgi:hypothetical protein